MKRRIPSYGRKPALRGPLVTALAIGLLFALVVPSTAQVTSYEKYIYLSGQLTNTLTGAPIPGHDIYITSDSASNNGFSYYAVTKTDANGFYLDTIVTSRNDGILKLYLYDYSGNIFELERYYRFVWENTYLMFANFSIIDPNTTTDFQANFKTMGDPVEDNPLKVLFRDLSIGNSIKAWEWDFGDGTTSEVQDPEHTYELPGLYRVTLTVSSLPPEFEVFRKSTITKQVQVGLTEFAHLGGHVFAQYFPIDFGLAYLYAYDENDQLVPVDTTEIDTLGYYYFYQLPLGKYLTKARLAPNSVLYGQFMPTYLGDVFVWDESSPVDLDKENWEADIALLPSSGINAGQGQILGRISYDTTHSSGQIIPADDVEILLLNNGGTSLTCGMSDMEGYFVFSGIDYGTYQLYPDVAGIPTLPMYVTISEDKPNASGVSLVILPEQITFSIDEIASDFVEDALLIYPNPVADEAKIKISMKKASALSVVITDLAGRTVIRQDYSLHKGDSELVLSARHLPAGCYQVVLIPEDHIVVTGKFLKYN